jgi:hypothetical protein
MTEVCAITPYSCALACVESILKDQGVDLSQQDMLERFSLSFPKWKDHAGLLVGEDYELLFELAGLPVTLSCPATFAETIDNVNDPSVIGVILGTSRFWGDPSRKTLIDCWHALRILSADKHGVTTMNPVLRPGPVVIEKYGWEVIESFMSQPLVFKRKNSNV